MRLIVVSYPASAALKSKSCFCPESPDIIIREPVWRWSRSSQVRDTTYSRVIRRFLGIALFIHLPFRHFPDLLPHILLQPHCSLCVRCSLPVVTAAVANDEQTVANEVLDGLILILIQLALHR